MPWVDIANSAIDSGSILPQSVLFSLRDNFEGMANGDAGAPRIQTAALDNYIVTNAKIANGAITVIKMSAPSAADTYVLHYNRFTENTAVQYRVNRAGSYRIKVIGTNASSVDLQINGTVAYTLSSYTTDDVQNQDFSVAAGDMILVDVNGLSSDPESTDYVRISICCDEPFTFYLTKTYEGGSSSVLPWPF